MLPRVPVYLCRRNLNIVINYGPLYTTAFCGWSLWLYSDTVSRSYTSPFAAARCRDSVTSGEGVAARTHHQRNILRVVYTFRQFQVKRVLCWSSSKGRHYFVPSGQEVTLEWRRPHNEELYATYFSVNTIRVIRWIGRWWVKQVECMGTRDANRIWVGNVTERTAWKNYEQMAGLYTGGQLCNETEVIE